MMLGGARQRDAYAGQYGTRFVALEVAGRLRPELDDATRRVTWLRWLADNATVTRLQGG